MKTFDKVSLVLVVAFLTLIVALAIWWPGGLGSLIPGGASQAAAAAAADLSSADDFAVLAGSAITNTGDTIINGDLGISPGSSVTGFLLGYISGTEYINDAVAAQAQVDLTAAYIDVAGQTPVSTVPTELGSTVKTAGIYDSASGEFGITGTLTLDAEGDPNAVFIFKSASTLITEGSSNVELLNGAQACNVFWQVGSSATLGTNSYFAGSILALTSITLTTGAEVEGRVLARNGAVTFDTNIVSTPTCSSGPSPATLHVIKLVVNGSGGTATAADFTVYVQDGGVDVSGSPETGTSTPGTLYTLPAGTYVVSEDADPLYTQSFTGACDSDGSITLLSGADEICTIVNTDIPPPAPVAVSSGGGAGPLVPLIGILKVPTPLSLPGTSGSVTYNYTVWNVAGQRALTDITVTDDRCAPLVLLSGNIDGDANLDIDETWNYSCTTTLATTTTNTAIATGYSADPNHDITVATAIATVVVGVPGLPNTGIVPPLIDIVKVPSRLTPFPVGGGMVSYTYTVTNPGVVPIHEVVVSDDTCDPVYRTSGDTNDNDLLEPSESWIYTCQTMVPISTRNIAMVEGRVNGFLAVDYAFATVLVAAPGLPNTGFPPKESVGLPLRLKIPKINVDTTLESVGLTAEGAMDVPERPTNAAWFKMGPRPGEKGTSVISGHFGWKNNIPAAFDDLHKLQTGDKFYVEDEKGETLAFVVRDMRTYATDEDASEAFGLNDGGTHLNLITCGGVWDEAEKTYSDRLVVFADRD